MDIKLTKEQLKVLLEIINKTNFAGESVEFIVELKKALQNVKEEVKQDGKNKTTTNRRS